MRIRRGTLALVVLYVAVTGLMVLGVGSVFTHTRFGTSNSYHAIFSDASGLKSGNDVRAAGVVVGEVKELSLAMGGVRVSFDVAPDVHITSATLAQIRWADLTGDRYLDLSPGSSAGTALPAGSTIPMQRTEPALNLDTLFQGFNPLLQGLNPTEINQLTANIVAVSQGQAGAVQSLLANVANFTTGLADHDALIGDTISRLSTALGVIDGKRNQFDQLITGLNTLTSGLASDRSQISSSLRDVDTLATEVTGLLRAVGPDLKANLDQLGTVATQLNAESGTLAQVLQLYPATIQKLGRGGAYGSFFNFFLCSVQVNVTVPGAPTISTPTFASDASRCKFPSDR